MALFLYRRLVFEVWKEKGYQAWNALDQRNHLNINFLSKNLYFINHNLLCIYLTFFLYFMCFNLFVLFKKSNFLRKHHLLFYLSYKNV